MNFNSVEQAYESLANYILAFIGSRSWDISSCSMRMVSNMATSSQSLVYSGVKDELGGFENNSTAMWNGLDAALFLRDNLLATTGDRIWGLTFTLFPDGKFKIEYDYNKPEGYEETDETISMDDAVKGLSDFN